MRDSSQVLAALCGISIVSISVLIKAGAPVPVVFLSLFLLVGLLVFLYIVSRGRRKADVDDCTHERPPITEVQQLRRLSKGNLRDLRRKIDSAQSNLPGSHSQYVLIELDKVCESLLDIIMEDVIKEYNREQKINGSDQDFKRLTVGEKVAYLQKILEKRDAAYIGSPSRVLVAIRDGLRSARHLRNRIAHQSNLEVPERIVEKARKGYLFFFEIAMEELAE